MIKILIANQTIIIKWTNSGKKHYESKGYLYTKVGNEFKINVEDLSRGSNKKVLVKCDYCGNTFEKSFKYIKENIKDACRKCNHKKGNETNLKKYGVKSPLQLKEVKNKRKQTMLKKYGVEHNMQIKEVQERMQQKNIEKYGNVCTLHGKEIEEKTKQTWLQKYGVEHCLQSNEVRQKIKDTNLKRYGFTVPVNNEKIKQNIKKNNLEKYGVEYSFQREDVKEKIKQTCIKRYGNENAICKILQTKYENKTMTCTKPQEYIFNLLNEKYICRLNYPIDNLALDIVYPEEMIYIEYDGGGHTKSIKCGWMTEKEFYKKEMRRNKYLESLGWKLIRIISNNDLIPQDKDIINLIKEAKDYLLNSNHNWYKIDIDKMQIECKEYIKSIKLNNLRRISEKILEEQVKNKGGNVK